MTLTIKEPPELTSLGKPGSPSQNSENRSDQSPRSNPVCLEVPIVVRSLPGEHENAPGVSGPVRDEGKSVIVFDNGAVLRISTQLPPGQTVILSNQQGRDVVCRVMGGRSLPSKGYIEVEFIEPVDDFWRIHQTSGTASGTAPSAPVLAPPKPAAVEQSPAPPVTPSIAPSAKESNAPSGSAPTFEDIAGLVRMAPLAGANDKKDKKIEAPPSPSALKGNSELTSSTAEIVKSTLSTSISSSISGAPTEKPTVVPAREAVSSPARTPVAADEFMGKGILASPYSPSAASPGESRGRMQLIVGGLALVLVGFGAGYFFMHRASAPAMAPVAVTKPLSEQPTPAPSSAPIPASVPEVDQAPPQTAQPISTPPPVSTDVAELAPSDSQKPRRQVTTAEAKQPDREFARRPTIPNLKMSSPTAPRRDLTKLAEGSSQSAADVTSTVATSGVPATLLPSVVRGENQPSPPLSPALAASAAKSLRDPKLLSSTRPTYPVLARQSNSQGTVVVTARVDANGNVVDAKAISGPILLRQAAQDTVKQWKYSPALIDGKPSASQVTVSLEFHLN